jgi:hypothetical protein
MLINLSSAVGRLVLAGREMTRLAGFTSRVTELMSVLDDLNAGYYERTMVGDATGGTSEEKKVFACLFARACMLLCLGVNMRHETTHPPTHSLTWSLHHGITRCFGKTFLSCVAVRGCCPWSAETGDDAWRSCAA